MEERPMIQNRRFLFAAVLAILAGLPFLIRDAAAADEAELWRLLGSGNHVALMRHALAPGTGDPDGFQLRDCATQRNLDDQGRAQAARIGDRIRRAGLKQVRVVSSQWCRCLETARLLGLGPVEDLPALNSFFQRWDDRAPQTRALATWIAEADLSRPTVLVSHQVNISALTGSYTQSGEMVIARRSDDGALRVVGSIATN